MAQSTWHTSPPPSFSHQNRNTVMQQRGPGKTARGACCFLGLQRPTGWGYRSHETPSYLDVAGGVDREGFGGHNWGRGFLDVAPIGNCPSPAQPATVTGHTAIHRDTFVRYGRDGNREVRFGGSWLTLPPADGCRPSILHLMHAPFRLARLETKRTGPSAPQAPMVRPIGAKPRTGPTKQAPRLELFRWP